MAVLFINSLFPPITAVFQINVILHKKDQKANKG